MGVAANGSHPHSDIAPRAPLLKFLEITPGYSPPFRSTFALSIQNLLLFSNFVVLYDYVKTNKNSEIFTLFSGEIQPLALTNNLRIISGGLKTRNLKNKKKFY